MQGNLLSIFVLAVVATVAIEAAVLPQSVNGKSPRERKGFRLLGTMKKAVTVTKFGVTSEIYKDWDYWESVNAAGWADAKKDCEGNGDTLLYIETREEVQNVTEFLQDTDNTGTLYWVGGKYDVRSSDFVWDNGVAFNPSLPWSDGHPRDKKANTRVATTAIGREIELKTQANTVATRYICEGERAEDGDQEQIPVPCFKDNDLVIVVDSSGSIQDPHYVIAKEFTQRLATTWIDHIGSRVAVHIFADITESIFGLTDSQEVTPIREKVNNMRHIKGDTRSHLGLILATEEIQNNARAVLKNIVFLTDGGTNPASFKPDTKAAAERAISLGIRTFSVGIGTNIDQAELLSIAGGNADHVFNTNEFSELLTLLRPISLKVCEE